MSYERRNLWPFYIRKSSFSWRFIALNIWNISIPDNKYYMIIVFIWIGYFSLFFLSNILLASDTQKFMDTKTITVQLCWEGQR